MSAAPSRSSAGALSYTLISPHRGWFEWRLRQLWRYRDLISLFVWRDFVSVYKQTMLGPAWHIVRPLLTTVIFTIVFGRMARLSTDGAPPFLFYMAGQVAWSYFSNCIDNVSRTFIANSQLLGKVYFHRLVIPLSLVISNLVSFAIQLCVFLATLLVYLMTGASVHATSWILALPLVVLLLGGYALAGGIIVCALTTRYRDLTYLVTFGVQLLMYLTPVIYPISSVPDNYLWLARLNPLAPVLEAFRRGLLGIGTVTIEELAVSAAVMVLLLVGGLMLFTRVEQTFMDTV